VFQLVQDGIFDDAPIAGVEASRYLNQLESECKYAEMAAVTIAATSANIAKLWIENGILSSEARASARTALAARYQLADFAGGSVKATIIIEQTERFSMRYGIKNISNDTIRIVTGPDFRLANKIGIFQVDALLLDAADAPGVGEG